MNASDVFRRQAVEHHERRAHEGDMLRLNPGWARWVFRLVVLSGVLALLFVCVVPVREYASGPAVVRVDGRRAVTAVLGGTVEQIAAQPGQRVRVQEALLSMNADLETAELDRATRELDLQIARLLRDPSDTTAKQTLSALKGKRDQAENALEQRIVRAPADGRVTEIHVRPGQRVTEGDIILTIAPEDTSVYVLAIVAGDYRPMLAKGQPVRFSLDGFQYDYRDLSVDSVSEEAIGPVEAKRYFGPELADALSLSTGAKTLFRARIPLTSFTFEGTPYGYFDGLTGTADVQVRSEPILVMLIPALREIWH